MGTENKPRKLPPRNYRFYVACKATQVFSIGSVNSFAKLLGPFDTAAEAHDWHRTVVDRIEEIGTQHPADILVIGRTAKTKGLFNEHFGYNPPD